MNRPDIVSKNRRILVIDDNHAIHDDFRKILSPPATAALDATEAELFGKPADAAWQAQFEIDSAYQGQEGVLLAKKSAGSGAALRHGFCGRAHAPGLGRRGNNPENLGG